MGASPRVVRWNCLCHSRTLRLQRHRTTTKGRYRWASWCLTRPSGSSSGAESASQRRSLFAVCCSAIQHQPQRKPAARCCRPPCEHPDSRLLQCFRIPPSAPCLRPRRHFARPFPALLRFPLTHDLVGWSGGSKFNLHIIRLNYLRRCWMDASCLPHGTSPTLTASPSLGPAHEKTECPKRCCPLPDARPCPRCRSSPALNLCRGPGMSGVRARGCRHKGVPGTNRRQNRPRSWAAGKLNSLPGGGRTGHSCKGHRPGKVHQSSPSRGRSPTPAQSITASFTGVLDWT